MSTKTVKTSSWYLEEQIFVCGVSFRDTDIEARERISLSGEKLDRFREILREIPEVLSSLVLATCNRVEIVIVARSGVSKLGARNIVLNAWGSVLGVDCAENFAQVYCLDNSHAVEHIYRVACGLDSMVLGEPQVLGQLKNAFRDSLQQNESNYLLQHLFQQSFSVAKSIRAETNICRLPVSVAYAAKVLCEHIFGSLSGLRVLLIGAGETGELVLRHLMGKDLAQISILNRTPEHAQRLADEFGGVAHPLQALDRVLADADIIIATASIDSAENEIIPLSLASHVAAMRRGEMQLFIDLGVPRNIAAGVSNLSDVFLYNVDDLESVVIENAKQRQEAAAQAEELIGSEVERFLTWTRSRPVHETIRSARQRIEGFERFELEKSIRRIRRLGFSQKQCGELEEVLKDYSNGILAKVLHQPINSVRSAGVEDSKQINSFCEYFLDNGKAESENFLDDQKVKKIGNS